MTAWYRLREGKPFSIYAHVSYKPRTYRCTFGSAYLFLLVLVRKKGSGRRERRREHWRSVRTRTRSRWVWTVGSKFVPGQPLFRPPNFLELDRSSSNAGVGILIQGIATSTSGQPKGPKDNLRSPSTWNSAAVAFFHTEFRGSSRKVAAWLWRGKGLEAWEQKTRNNYSNWISTI